jgi:hypothetical protein
MKYFLQLSVIIIFITSCGQPKPSTEDQHKQVLKDYLSSKNYQYTIDDVRFTTTEIFSNKAACTYAYENLYNRISSILNSGVSNDTLIEELLVEQKKFEECVFPEGDYKLVKYKFSFELDTDYEYFIIIDNVGNVFYAGNVYKK